MGIYNDVDIAVSPNGDLVISSTGDLQMALPSGVLKQDIAFRVRTDPTDFIPHPELGAGLDDLIGEPNSRANAKIGESKIINSLTYDTRISNSDLYVRGVPISLDAVVYYIFVNNGGIQLNVTPGVSFNIGTGFNNLLGV